MFLTQASPQASKSLSLADDHANAQILATGLAELPPISLDPSLVRTNIVIFEVLPGDAADSSPALGLARSLAEHGVLAVALDPQTMRLVTHRDVGEPDCRQTLATITEIMAS